MNQVERLERRLFDLKNKKVVVSNAQKVALLKKQIRREEFNQSKTGKTLDAIARIGLVGGKVLKKVLSEQKGGVKKYSKDTMDMINNL